MRHQIHGLSLNDETTGLHNLHQARKWQELVSLHIALARVCPALDPDASSPYSWRLSGTPTALYDTFARAVVTQEVTQPRFITCLRTFIGNIQRHRMTQCAFHNVPFTT